MNRIVSSEIQALEHAWDQAVTVLGPVSTTIAALMGLIIAGVVIYHVVRFVADVVTIATISFFAWDSYDTDARYKKK